MKSNKHMTPDPEQKLEEAMEDARELTDEELEVVVGGLRYQLTKPPSDEAPPIESPFLNPFS